YTMTEEGVAELSDSQAEKVEINKRIFAETSVEGELMTAKVTTVTIENGKETKDEIEFSGTEEEVKAKLEDLLMQ
ncbi:MAG TPA: hypothetical protein VFD80_00750, partial [Flavobacteriaceae bacterium]|nr:hypothetical protein [Flavobacteriaceae bacterium]